MANSFSILHNFDNVPLYTPDYQFLSTALQYKQNAIDTNRLKVQNLYDQFSMLDVHNDVDRQYIEDRLQQVKNISNNYSNLDPSDPIVAQSLINTVSTVLDDKVRNAVYSTQIIKSEDAEWDKMRKEKRELYSELNHEYAIQRSGRRDYEKSGEAGALYRGGANFIEYRDLSKKLMENIPKLQQALKAEWIETGPQQGYFRSIDKYEAIDRDKMNSALDLVFDEKDKQQLGINAWGTYGSVPESELKLKWDNYYEPEKEQIIQRKNALEILRRDPRNRANIEQITGEIDKLDQMSNNLESFSFENMASRYGKQGVYQTLYNQEYKDSILDAYTYAPRLIDRKVDEVQARNVEFRQKLEEFSYQKQKDAAQLTLSSEKFGLEKQKFSLELQKYEDTRAKELGTGPAQQQGVIYGQGREIETPGVTSSYILDMQKQDRGAIEGIYKLTGSYPTKDDYGDHRTELSDLAGKARRGETITLNGRKINVKDNLSTLLEYQNSVLTETPDEKVLRQTLSGGVQQIIGNLRQLTQAYDRDPSNSDMNPYDLPRFAWKIEIDPTTKKAKKVSADPAKHNYARILRKDKSTLTESEKATLQAYTTFHIVGDTDLNISDDVRRQYFKTLKYNTLSNMPENEFDKIAKSVDEVKSAFNDDTGGTTGREYSPGFKKRLNELKVLADPRQYSQNTNYNSRTAFIQDKYVSQVDKLAQYYQDYTRNPNQDTRKKIQDIEQTIRNQSMLVQPKQLGQDYYLSELTAADVEYINTKGKEVSLNTFSKIVEDANVTIDANLGDIKKTFQLPEYQNPIVTPTNPQYETIKAMMVQDGKISDSYKGSIEINPAFDKVDVNGVTFKEGVELIARESGKQKGTPYVSSKTTVANLADIERTGFNLNRPKRPAYDTKYGNNALSIDLGNVRMMESESDAVIENFDQLKLLARQRGLDKELFDKAEKYQKGEFVFSFEPKGATYHQTIRDSKGNLVYQVPTADAKFDYDDVSNIYNRSADIASKTMYNYLFDLVNSPLNP